MRCCSGEPAFDKVIRYSSSAHSGFLKYSISWFFEDDDFDDETESFSRIPGCFVLKRLGFRMNFFVDKRGICLTLLFKI